MIVGIMADSHDALPSVALAMRIFAERKAEMILHAGDIVAPFTARAIVDSGIPVHAVFGNNDGEKVGLAKVINGICEPPLALTLMGIPVVLAHTEEEAGEVRSGVVVTGHTHKQGKRTQNGVTFINPGECCGYLSGKQTVVIWDTVNAIFELVEL